MTQSVSQNENIDKTILALLNSNKAQNKFDIKNKTAQKEFSNIVNVAASNVEKTRSEFIDRAVKTNTDSINKFILKDSQKLKNSNLKDFTPTSIFDNAKEVTCDFSDFTFEKISVKDKFLSIFYPEQEQAQTQETDFSFENAQNINLNITLDSSAQNSALIMPSPDFSLENQELSKDFQPIEISDNQTPKDFSQVQNAANDKNYLESNIPFSIMFDRIAARNVSCTDTLGEADAQTIQTQETLETKSSDILALFDDVLEKTQPEETTLKIASDVQEGELDTKVSSSDKTDTKSAFNQSFSGSFDESFDENGNNNSDFKESNKQNNFSFEKKVNNPKTDTQEETFENKTVKEVDKEQNIESDFIEDIKKELKTEIKSDNSNNLSHALSVSDDVAKMSIESDSALDFSSVKTNVDYSGQIVANSNNVFLKTAPLNNTNPLEQSFETVFEKNNILNQIGSKFENLKDAQGQKLTLILRPNDLGRVSIQLTSDSNGLTTNILAQNDEVRAYLEKNIHVLKQQLSDSGINVNSIQIKTQGQDASSSYEGNKDFSENQQQNNQQQNNKEQQNKHEKEQILFSMSDYDTHFEKDFSSIFNKTINYNL